MEASDSPKQAQHLPTSRKVQMETPESIRASDSRGMGVAHRPVGCLLSYPLPPKLEEVPTVLPEFRPIPGPLAHQGPSQEEAQVKTQIVVDLT